MVGLLSLERLATLTGWLCRTRGASRVRITGGEPLVRPGIVSFVEKVALLPGVSEVAMTTNGTRLGSLARQLRTAGLARVNVSLDTLDPDRFADLTRGGDVLEVLAGIESARNAGLEPVKLNAVLRASSFQADVPALLDLAARDSLEVRFIELMRTGTGAAWAACEYVPISEVRAWVGKRVAVEPVMTGPPGSPARRTRVTWKGRDIVVGWISPVSHAFCAGCSRLRLDARGQLRRCLMDPAVLPLEGLVDGGDDETRLVQAVATYLNLKRPPAVMATHVPMISIGG